MSDINAILDLLIQRTVQGRLPWKRTAGRDEFFAPLDATTVVVKDLTGPRLPLPGRYQLVIVKRDGATVEVLETGDEFGMIPADRAATPLQQQKLVELYRSARSYALDIQSALDELSSDLNKF